MRYNALFGSALVLLFSVVLSTPAEAGLFQRLFGKRCCKPATQCCPVEATPAPCASPCGESPCGESPCGESPCGESPCGESPCGESPCGETPCDPTPCAACGGDPDLVCLTEPPIVAPNDHARCAQRHRNDVACCRDKYPGGDELSRAKRECCMRAAQRRLVYCQTGRVPPADPNGCQLPGLTKRTECDDNDPEYGCGGLEGDEYIECYYNCDMQSDYGQRCCDPAPCSDPAPCGGCSSCGGCDETPCGGCGESPCGGCDEMPCSDCAATPCSSCG